MAHEAAAIRVWHVFRLYYPNFAGSAVQAELITKSLLTCGFSFKFLVAADLEARKLKGTHIRQENFEIFYLRILGRINWNRFRLSTFGYIGHYINNVLINLSFSAGVIWTLYRYGSPGDLLHLHSLQEFSFLIEWFAKLRGMKTILLMTLLGSDDPLSILNNNDPLKLLRVNSFNHADVIVSLCTAQDESCRLSGIDAAKVIRIPCAVDTEKYKPLNGPARLRMRKTLNLPTLRRYIIFVGAALQRKGIDVLVQAFIHVSKHFDDVDLLIVGPNDFSDAARHPPGRKKLLAELEECIEKAGLLHRVYWIGEVMNVHQYLQCADVFCFPSRREGFGIVIVEAMASGLPVVVSRLEGVVTDYLSESVDGFMLDGHNPEEYAHTLQKILNNSAKAQNVGSAARERVENGYSLDIVAQEYARLYTGLVVNE